MGGGGSSKLRGVPLRISGAGTMCGGENDKGGEGGTSHRTARTTEQLQVVHLCAPFQAGRSTPVRTVDQGEFRGCAVLRSFFWSGPAEPWTDTIGLTPLTTPETSRQRPHGTNALPKTEQGNPPQERASLTSRPPGVSPSPRAARPLMSMELLHGSPDAALIAAPMLTPAARATR